MPLDDDRWLRYCRMTCDGGSENGLCNCTHAANCLLQNDPEYPAAYEAGHQRMWLRVFMPALLMLQGIRFSASCMYKDRSILLDHLNFN